MDFVINASEIQVILISQKYAVKYFTFVYESQHIKPDYRILLKVMH